MRKPASQTGCESVESAGPPLVDDALHVGQSRVGGLSGIGGQPEVGNDAEAIAE